jgi:putative endonuclease
MNILKNKEILSFGRRGEKTAVLYLKKLGYKILSVNFSNPYGRRLGEIDIIAKDGEELVFVEVKTRKDTISTKQPLPEESITQSKLYKLNKIASFYVSKNQLHDTIYRFDAILIVVNPITNWAKVRHLKNIFI